MTKALLVEDDPGDARLVRKLLLEDPGAPRVDLAVVPRARDALLALAAGGVDVVLLALPDSAGVPAIHAVVEEAPAVPVVVLAARGSPDVAEEALATGADEFLVKGRFDGAALRRAIEHAIARRRAGSSGMRQALGYVEEIVDTVREPLVVLDGDLRVVRANRSFYEFFGVGEEDAVGRPLEETGPGTWEDRDLASLLRGVIETGKGSDGHEIAYRPRDEEERTLLLNARQLRLPSRRPHQVLLALEDVTERKRADALLAEKTRELERSNRELEQFAYVASHDLQEPLRMVASYLALLERRYGDRFDKDAHEFIGYAVDGASRMQRLIQDLLAYSHVGQGALVKEEVAVDEVLDRALKGLEVAIADAGARIERAPMPTVKADGALLGLVFQNLLSNALKFRGQEPLVVRVGAERDGGAWRFTVADNGIGIDPKHHDRVFVLFQRLHGRHEHPGTGLGLSICRKIVERHGGRLWVESAPGKGAAFHFTVPA